MRSEIVGVWSEIWREVWLPLIDQPLSEGEDDAPEDIFCELYREVARALKAQPSIEALADVIDDPVQSREAFEKTTAGERAVVTFLEAHPALDDLGGDELSNRYFNLLSPVSSTSSVCATTCGVPAFCARLCPRYLRASCATCGHSPNRTRTSTRS